MENPEKKTLNKALSMVSVISIAAGAVIGGWLAEAPYWFSLAGASSAFVFLVLAVLLIPVGLAFAEMSAMLPFTSSVAVWTAHATNHQVGWYTQWLMFLIQIVEPPLCAFILTTALGFFIPFTQAQTMLVAVGLCVVWYIVSNFNVRISGKLSTVFFFTMVILSLIVAAMFFLSGKWNAGNLAPGGTWLPGGGHGLLLASGVLTLKFIGFELTPTLLEEINFPAKKLSKVILASLFIPALLYALVVIAMGGMAPGSRIAAASLPEPELIRELGLPMVFAWMALIAGSLHGLTTFMGFWTSSARVLYGSAQLNMLPHAFLKLNRNRQPHWANLTVLVFSVLFCLFSASNWVKYIYAVSCIAAGLVYMMVCYDTYRLRITHPEWPRPYRAPFGNGFLFAGMAVSAWVVVASSLTLDLLGWSSLAAYMVLGVVIYFVMQAYRRRNPGKMAPVLLTPENAGQTK